MFVKSEKLGVITLGFSPVVREGLHTILTKDEIIEVIGDAADGHAAIQGIKQARDHARTVNVVLTDTANVNMDGKQVTRLIKDEFPEIAILVLTENPDDSYIIDAINAGAGGYMLLKDITPEALLQSIHRVVDGVMQIKTELLHTAVENLIQNGRKTLAERTAEAAHLTEREVDVLRLMGNGDSNKIIAETLGITLDTVKKHVRNAIDKLEARSRTHAAIMAVQAGIVGNSVAILIEKPPEPD